ncbi:MFS transporter [Falsiroseomonas sp.]|uniref:MFS transporter n=1 Tax=Falsiroseomonas sp. TaxID=2870721 RepID=UPI003563BA83
MDIVAARRLVLIGLGSLVVPLDTALNIAFPPITAHFGLALPGIQWLVICYVLTYGSLMLGIGRLGDIFGHALVFRAGLAWSAVALLLCALAPSYEWLLLSRVLQGVGAALVISCGPALATGLFPEALRARVLGIYGLMFAAGSALGPMLGGALVAQWGWPAVFWFRAPIVLLALVLLWDLRAPPRTTPREPFDASGAALLTLTIGSALLAINQLRHLGDGGHWAPLLAMLALAAGWGFLQRSRRAAHPVIALAVFRLPGFARLNAANALVNLAGFAVLLFVPYYLARVAGWPTALAGLVLAASPAGTMLAAVAGGWLLGRVPAARMVGAGVALTGGGLGLMGFWAEATPFLVLLAALLLHGVGLGLLQVSYTDTVTATLPKQDRGVAGSLAMMTRTLGIVAAASLLTLLFGALEEAALNGGTAGDEAFLRAFRGSLLLAAALCGAVLIWLLRGRR